MKQDKAVEKEFENQFDIFLLEYLKNVEKELPTSFRAQQMKIGGFSSKSVIEFETKFLKEPFLKALQITAKDKDKEIKLSRQIDKIFSDNKIKQLQKELNNLKFQRMDLSTKLLQLQNQLKNCSEVNLDLINKGKELEKENKELAKEIFDWIEPNLVMPYEGTLQSNNKGAVDIHGKITDYVRDKFNEGKMKFVFKNVRTEELNKKVRK